MARSSPYMCETVTMVKYLKQEKLFSKSLPQVFPPKSGNQKKAGHGSVQQNGTSYKTA